MINKKQYYDGTTHINIYSQGQTELGVFLSNFYCAPISTEDGRFDTIEGYWHWLGTHEEKLRTMDGWSARKYGKQTRRKYFLSDEEFKRKIKIAIRTKIYGNPRMFGELVESILPFEHYYCYGDKPIKGGSQWVVNFIEELRRELKS